MEEEIVYEYGRGWEYVWWEINKNNAVDYLLEQEWYGEINELEKIQDVTKLETIPSFKAAVRNTKAMASNAMSLLFKIEKSTSDQNPPFICPQSLAATTVSIRVYNW